MGTIRQLYPPNLADHPNLEQLFSDYYDRLVFFAWQIVKDQQQAEDIAQEAFISYWQKRDQVAGHPVAIKNFLYRAARNASLDIIRHLQVVDQFMARQPGIEPSEAYILESIISAEIIAEVNHAIELLPAHLIRLSKLSFLELKKNHEVADELKLSVNTVKKQKRRALDLLRVHLNPEIILILVSCGGYFTRK